MSSCSVRIGIVGLPNVGKSTLFNALTEKSVPAENYPFCTIDPSVGVVAVPDARLDTLTKLSSSVKTLPAAIEFVDIAGLVKGAAEGEGLGNQFLAHIREVDAIAMVVRIFEDENVHHVHGAIHPLDDVTVISFELVLADIETVTKRLARVGRDAKSGDKEAKLTQALCEKLLPHLEEGYLANVLILTDEEKEIARTLHLLTMKPFLYVLNKKTGARNLDEHPDGRYEKLIDYFEENDAVRVVVDAGIEQELSQLSMFERDEYRRELGLPSGDVSGVNALIKKSFETLDLIVYFTTGETESRAWPIQRGSSAPRAGRAIHSDFEEKFIRAEVIACDKLIDAGSYSVARVKGYVRTEGKEYIVQDGDVIEFKI
ncbi:MAG: redox-regulated ATPase YchF [bacterium]|nr:redox-regulated ATPase YchF [bacterium]